MYQYNRRKSNSISLKEVKDRTIEKIESGIEWAKDNPEATAAISGAVVFVAKGLRKANRNHREFVAREKDVWDPVAGIHYYLKKRMTRQQKAEYARLVELGYNRAEVLKNMRLL